MKIVRLLTALAGVLLMFGCATSPTKLVKEIELGMTPGEVLERMGEPHTIRAAQLQEGQRVMEVWEYSSPLMSFNPRTYLLIFREGKLIRWGIEDDIDLRTLGASR